MAESHDSGTAPARATAAHDTTPQLDELIPAGNTAATDAPTVQEDIGRVLLDLVNVLDDVKCGLTAFLLTATDNNSEFARTAHWMIGKVDVDLLYALGLAKAAQTASRVESRAADRNATADAEEAAARLRAFAATEPKELPHMTVQKAIDGAVADAVFVLAQALRWGQFEPMVEGLRRAGVAS